MKQQSMKGGCPEGFSLHCGDSAEVLKNYPDNYFHSVVCDPP